jgi:hypothetical protein
MLILSPTYFNLDKNYYKMVVVKEEKLWKNNESRPLGSCHLLG